jgi:hypothetical protein
MSYVRPPVSPPPQRAPVRRDRIYLGWQYAPLHGDPGPMPRRPVPPAAAQLNQGWLEAQQREDRRLSRPLKAAAAVSLAGSGLLLGLGLAGLLNASLTSLGMVAGLAAAAASGRGIRRGELDLRERISAEQQRVARIRAVQQRQLAERQQLHARRVRAWESRRQAFDRQLQWYAVSLPSDIDRVDVVGGTIAGWAALLAMIAAPRLSADGDVTVLDLTEGGVARDLLAVARRSGITPLVWVMPGDLSRLDLGAGLPAEALADVLAATVAASDEPGARGGTAGGGLGGAAALDTAILERVLGVLGGQPSIAQVTAALRALAQVGDPRDDLKAGLLTSDQLERISALYGRGAADRVVIDRTWAIESRLRKLEPLGSAPVPLPPSQLRVAWLDRRAAALGNRVLATYMTVALTHMLRQAARGRRWQETLCVLGAEKLHADVLDRLVDSCELSGTGLVVGYRSIPGHVRERIGRGNAAIAFMRLGNAEDARAASEQIGAEHRFVISQLTETVGGSLTDTAAGSYTSTVGSADSVADSTSVSDSYARSSGRGRSRQAAAAPFGHFTASRSTDRSQSRGTSQSRSITAGLSASTAWGISTSKAVSGSSSAATTSQRSRELLVEPHELQQLPPSAVIVTYAAPEGRRVELADANPGIIGLRTSTLLSLEEARSSAAAPHAAGGPQASSGPPPNLGPPPERLDWRTPR